MGVRFSQGGWNYSEKACSYRLFRFLAPNPPQGLSSAYIPIPVWDCPNIRWKCLGEADDWTSILIEGSENLAIGQSVEFLEDTRASGEI